MKRSIPFIFAISLTCLLIQGAFAGGSSSGGGDQIGSFGKPFYAINETETCEALFRNSDFSSDAVVTCRSDGGCTAELMRVLCEKQ